VDAPVETPTLKAQMKDRFALVRTTHTERRSISQHAAALATWYRRAGRACLVAAAVCGGVDVFNSVQGSVLPHITLRSMLNLSPLFMGPGFTQIQAAIELVMDAPLWALLVVAAAIPYSLAVERFIKAA
jgi:hypothetical protein